MIVEPEHLKASLKKKKTDNIREAEHDIVAWNFYAKSERHIGKKTINVMNGLVFYTVSPCDVFFWVSSKNTKIEIPPTIAISAILKAGQATFSNPLIK